MGIIIILYRVYCLKGTFMILKLNVEELKFGKTYVMKNYGEQPFQFKVKCTYMN